MDLTVAVHKTDLYKNLEQMRNTDILTVDPDTLVDYNDITINTSLRGDERLLDFIGQIKNPYCFKYGKTVIKVSFADTEATLEDRLEKYLLSI